MPSSWTVGPGDEDEGRNVPDDLNLHQHCCENFTTTKCCHETKVRNYQSTLHKVPKERRSHSHRVCSLKSRNYGSVTFSISGVFSLLCCSRVCWSFQIYENYAMAGKGQEEISWIASVCQVNILTAMNRALQCASVASFFQILCCVRCEGIMARRP